MLPVLVGGGRVLTAREFQGLADVPPEAEWFAYIDNRQTRRAYQNDIKDFMSFVAISGPEVSDRKRDRNGVRTKFLR